MTRTVTLIVFLALALVGLWWWTGRDEAGLPDPAPPPTPVVTPTDTTNSQVGENEVAGTAADAAADAAAVAADVAAETSAIAPSSQAATEAAQAAEQAIEAASRAAAAAAATNPGTETETAPVTGAPDPEAALDQAGIAARDAADATTRAGEAVQHAARIETLLTPEGFDRDLLVELVAASELPDADKNALLEVIRNAADGTALPDTTRDQLRSALQ